MEPEERMDETNGKKRKKKKKRSLSFRCWTLLALWIVLNIVGLGFYVLYVSIDMARKVEAVKKEMSATVGVNREIKDGDYDSRLAVTCDNGTFVCTDLSGVRCFRGVPYAEPPVGSLRWKPPVDALPDDGIYQAVYNGKSSIQTECNTEPASTYLQGEDCLTLNVFTAEQDDTAGGTSDGTSGNATDDATGGASDNASDDASGAAENGKRPVMVFFPGGAFGWGGIADPMYDGFNFVDAHRDVVLVTVNYRLGLMGFMDFSSVPGGEEYEESCNLGILDQVCALRWVQRNIAQFGGDPDNVTIFGESAGGTSVSLLPLVKEAKGLFGKVIAESGAVNFTFSREEAQAETQLFLKEANASTMDDLLALSEEELMKINEKVNDTNNFPVRDGNVLPEDLYAAYASGAAKDVVMLTGTNKDEVRYFIEDMGGYPVYRVACRLLYGATVSRMDKEDRDRAGEFDKRLDERPLWRESEFLNEILFRIPAVTQAQMHTQGGGTDYMYYWTKESVRKRFGACHAVELSYVFNNLEDTIYTGERADETLAATVQEMWVNFAKTGDPSTGEYQWDPYDTQSRKTMILGDEVRMEADPLREQRELVEPMIRYNFNGYYANVDYALAYLWRRILTGIALLAGLNLLLVLICRIWKRIRR